MTKTFTENDLVRYIYDDVNAEERVTIQYAISTNATLQTKYMEMMETSELLNDFVIKAPNDVVERILYAEKHIPSL